MERRECSASGIRLILKGLFGGPGRDRTDDLFHAMEARSQLRHRPTGGTILFSWTRNDSSMNAPDAPPAPRHLCAVVTWSERLNSAAPSNRRRFLGIVLAICLCCVSPWFCFW